MKCSALRPKSRNRFLKPRRDRVLSARHHLCFATISRAKTAAWGYKADTKSRLDRPPPAAALYLEVVTSKTTWPAFLPLADFPCFGFEAADLTTILPPAAVNARTS